MIDNYINIFTKNHQSESGISDYLEIITDILKERKIKYKISDKILINGKNILIEEFSDKDIISCLKRIKKDYPKTELYMILTEFIVKQKDDIGFNIFEKKNNLFKKLYFKISLKASEFGLFYRRIRLFKDRYYYKIINYLGSDKYEQSEEKGEYYYIKSITLTLLKIISRFFRLLFWIPKTIITKILYFLFNSDISKFFLFDLEQKYYMRKRFNGFKKIINVFDKLFCIHPAIEGQVNSYFRKECIVIYPKILIKRSNIVKSKFEVVSTGLQNNYRKKIIDMINAVLKSENSKYSIVMKNFESREKLKKYKYNLNIPLNREWNYSSPVRILRSVKNHQLPLVIKKFNDHPIEELAKIFNFKKVAELVGLDDKIYKKKISNYNSLSTKLNDKLYKTLKIKNTNSLNILRELYTFSDKKEILLHTKKYFFFKTIHKVFAAPNSYYDEKNFKISDKILTTNKVNEIVFYEDDKGKNIRVSTKFNDINQIYLLKTIMSVNIIERNKRGRYYVFTHEKNAIIYDKSIFVITKLQKFNFQKYEIIYKSKSLLNCVIFYRQKFLGIIEKNDSNEKINKIINSLYAAKFVLVE